jgi:hypothetical protein
MDEYFDSSMRPSGDIAGVFEFDGETGYFYLYEMSSDGENKIKGALNIHIDNVTFAPSDVLINWSSDWNITYLKISNKVYAVFDCRSGIGYSGNISTGVEAVIPLSIEQKIC